MRFSRNAISLFSVTCSLIIAMTGSAFAQVSADFLIRVTAVRDAYPYWSPDGKQIVFQSDRNSSMHGDFQIYVMNADGSNIKRRTFRKASDEAPVWSPDGKKILISFYITEENNELFIMNTDGSGIRQLTDSPGRDGHQKFSYDGTRIIFNLQRDEPGGYEIYEMAIDGSNIKRLTNFNGWDTYPSISPDGAKIVWRRLLPTGGSAKSGRNSEVFIMNRDGSNPVNLTNHPDFDGYPS